MVLDSAWRCSPYNMLMRLRFLLPLVLGGIFLTAVLWDLTMPEFSATMLALMGISSGTYIGFKLPMKTE